MGEIRSDVSVTEVAFNSINNAAKQCLDVSKTTLDEQTTVKGNMNAHEAIENLFELNKLVAQAIEEAAKAIQFTGKEFSEADSILGEQIGKKTQESSNTMPMGNLSK